MDNIQTKSKDRVGKFGEVYTPENIVKEMLDLIKNESYSIDCKILEPSCGTGRFLTEVIKRKLSVCKNNIDIIQAVSTVYGVDIIPDNVKESKEAMMHIIKDFCTDREVLNTVEYILDKNIILGDTLKCVRLKTLSDRGSRSQNSVAQPTVEDGALNMYEWRFNADRSTVTPVEFSLNQPELELRTYNNVSISNIVGSVDSSEDADDEYDYDDIL